MTRSCTIRDEQLRAFATGADERLIDEHVATCDECQEFLALLWDGGLDADLAEPVVEAIRLELFLIDVAKLFAGILGDAGKAVKVYLGGADEGSTSDG